MSRSKIPFAFLFVAGVGLAACSGANPSRANDAAKTHSPEAAINGMPQSSAANDAKQVAAGSAASATPDALPLLVVTKTPTCGCCHLWVEHMKQAGFQVEIHDVDDMGPAKERLGVPYGKGSCHTAEVGGYFVEGHVPAADVKRLLAETPDAKGLTLPGMPLGSPGMEMPDGRVQPYVVELVAKDGSTSPYASHGP